jgi:hypothetical protein
MKCEIEQCTKRASKQHEDHHFCDACWKKNKKCCPVCGVATQPKTKRKAQSIPTKVPTKKKQKLAPPAPQFIPRVPTVARITPRTAVIKTERIDRERLLHALRLKDNSPELDRKLCVINDAVTKGRLEVTYSLGKNSQEGRLYPGWEVKHCPVGCAGV